MKTEILELKENTDISVTEDIQYVFLMAGTNGALKEFTINIDFAASGVTAELLGIYSLGSNQNLKLTVSTNIDKQGSNCLIWIRGLLKNQAESEVSGIVHVETTAAKTKARFEHNALVTGEESTVKTKPILEIKNNDVDASHGATINRVDEEQIYYLTSRGIDRDEAEKMLIQGYFETLLKRIKDEKIREQVKIDLWH
jgi:Fe-S cluster assembly protein SufD